MKTFFKSEYLRNILTLLTGAAGAQAILLIISPVLSRLFTPADFGIFGLFTAISTVLGMVAAGRLEIAIMLPEEDMESRALFRLCLYIALGFSSLIFLTALFISPIESVRNSLLFEYRYWLAAGIFLQAAIQAWVGLLNRNKKYKSITKAKFLGGFGIAGFSIWLGWLKFGPLGLILGKISGQVIEVFFLNYSFNIFSKENYKGVKLRSPAKPLQNHLFLLKKYSAFAKFSTIEGLLNTFFKQIPIFALSVFSATAAGNYSFAQKIVGAPAGLLATSIGKVFFQNAVEKNRINDGSLPRFFRQNLIVLSTLVLPPAIILMLFAPILFEFIFGELWHTSGIYAAWLMPFIAVSFVKAPLSFIVDIKNKLKENLLFEFGFLVITSAAFYLAFTTNDPLFGIRLFSLGNATLGMVQLGWFYWLTDRKGGY